MVTYKFRYLSWKLLIQFIFNNDPDSLLIQLFGFNCRPTHLISVINDLLNNPVQEQRFRGEPRALILAPTRELALQIESDAKSLTKFSNLHLVTLLGGVDFD
ncbi:DEAD/DEAH box helicase, partial [Klebsiella pneumoniae]|nr:DEAD/DEAH box helicase [Klebsiella pneumoniae]